MQKVLIASDHAGFDVKEKIKADLGGDYEFVDLGTNSTESVDYPVYGEKLAQQIAVTPDAKGILVCGSANGICIAANKVNGARCAVGYSKEAAVGAREHNNAQILSIPGRNEITDDPSDIARTFLETEFSAEERHHRRVEQMMEIEKNN